MSPMDQERLAEMQDKFSARLDELKELSRLEIEKQSPSKAEFKNSKNQLKKLLYECDQL